MILPVKEFWKSINIWVSYGQEFSVFFDSPCIRNGNSYDDRAPINSTYCPFYTLF